MGTRRDRAESGRLYWNDQYGEKTGLDSATFWFEIRYDRSFAEGFQEQLYNLPTYWIWDASEEHDCDYYPTFHFAVEGSGLEVYEGVNPDVDEDTPEIKLD